MPKNYKTQIRREIAIKKLEGALQRANMWNKNHAWWIRIRTIVLVGSLARNSDVVGDVDLCIEIDRIKDPNEAERKDYFEWRKRVLGYAHPRDVSGLMRAIYSDDAIRYMKNKDGRLEMLQWAQLEVLSLSLTPIIPLMENGRLCSVDLDNLHLESKPISIDTATEYVSRNVPEKPRKQNDEFSESYCHTVSSYPEEVRNMILNRDATHSAFEKFKTTKKC